MEDVLVCFPLEQIRCSGKEGTNYLSEHDKKAKTPNISVDAFRSVLKLTLLCWCMSALENIEEDEARGNKMSTENVGRLGRARR